MISYWQIWVSSMQIDNPDRGFTFKAEGPLDLRMNPEKGISVAERLRDISKEELTGMLIENSDEPYAEEIAEAITEKIRKGGKIETTTGLHQVIEETLAFIPEKERKEAVRKSSQRVFQALRIDVNNEFEVLYDFLDKLPGVLKPGGKVAILTFHSGEDRLVKKSFKQWKKEGLYSEIAKRRHPTVQRRMLPQQPCEMHENALGNPGRRVRYKIRNRKTESRQRMNLHVRLIKKCGGCQLQKMPYKEQLKRKQKQEEQLLGGFCKVSPIIGMEHPYFLQK